ncbi:hypothetical protein BUALT_BualtUnG0027700 [Buddleja alternifolia]|uniref:Bifunctional inhibitor/plant lipid transfer protein/seed storage helical domain-containing protein n=1 Tax=Buddleja alternifolia TaxID=168488 RepID=A0AAV6W5D5_9LAMI|nr:hypothetical protein BUALT_BualtUnG0027700 [Buddleja alternifolia]
MVKLTVFAALFAALIAVVSATTYSTVDTEENPRQESCEQETKKQWMRHCHQWMMQRSGGGIRFYETPITLRSAVANPRIQEGHLKECCKEMKNIKSECRCAAIKQMVRRQQEYGMKEETQRMMMKRGESLPRMCKWEFPTECRMTGAVYF